ncbi:hypothetical protein KIH74_18410 [Kineosporia sp. J2-2]|uniref:Scramblase n=1 Tax=Kineosporia corallincola TaxID=2835133 RepID=A0ABS5TMU9_9ACTN|nr:hypothetical protein [Kineosporia corallincola]MBT0770919.1 hypothetical protein [Kineosporia corallincola]
MAEQDIPVWGTPEPLGDPGDSPQPAPAWGTPQPPAPAGPPSTPATDPRLTPVLATVLGTHSEIEVSEHRDFFGQGGYEILTPEGSRVASLTRQASATTMIFGDLSSSRFLLHDDTGVLAAELIRAGSLGGTMAFELYDRLGGQLATIEQENLMFAPRLRVHGPDGARLRMIGGAWGNSDRFEVVDGADDTLVLATLRERSNGMFSGTQRFRIRFVPGLTPVQRFVVAITAICMDQARDRKK